MGQHTILVYDADKLAAAAQAYVDQGPAHSRQVRQEEADGARVFLQAEVVLDHLAVKPSQGRGIQGDARAGPLPPPPAVEE